MELNKLSSWTSARKSLLLIGFLLVIDTASGDIQPEVADTLKVGQRPPLCLASKTKDGSQKCFQLEHISDPEERALWRWNYVEESLPGRDALILDQSFNSRLANMVYTFHSARHINSDIYSVNLGNQNLNQQYINMAAGSQVNQESCTAELVMMIQLYEEYLNLTETKRQGHAVMFENRHLTLARVMDTYGQYAGGGLEGDHWFFGHPNRCISRQLLLNTQQPANKTQLRYCVAKMNLEPYLDWTLSARERADTEPAPRLAVGICLPKSCHMSSFRMNKPSIQKLIDFKFQLPGDVFPQTNLEVDTIYCSPDTDSQLAEIPTSGKIYFILALSWTCMLAFITIRGYYQQNQRQQRVVVAKQAIQPNETNLSWLIDHFQDSFDVFKSFKDLVNTERRGTNPKARMDPLDMCKVLSCCFVVFGHTLLMKLATSTDFLQVIKWLEKDPVAAVLFAGTMVTDSFFVITGIVVTYSSLKKLKRRSRVKSNRTSGSWLKEMLYIAITRYLRLVPPYAVVFWTVKSFFSMLSSGHLWDNGLNKDTAGGACRAEDWLTPLTGKSAYLSLSKQCIPQAWSVADDMLFSFILGPVIVALAHRPVKGTILALVISLYSVAAMYFASLGIKPIMMKLVSDLKVYGILSAFSTLGYVYTGVQFRLFSVLIGVLAGYALFHYAETGEIKDWPNWFRGPMTKLALGYIITIETFPAVFTTLRSSEYDPYTSALPAELVAFGGSITRLLWAITNATLILRWITDWKDNTFAKLGHLSIWKILVRLNYCVLLVHLHVQIFEELSNEAIGPFSRYLMLCLASQVYAKSILVAALLYITVENPIQKFVRGISDRWFFGELEDGKVRAVPESKSELDQGKIDKQEKND